MRTSSIMMAVAAITAMSLPRAGIGVTGAERPDRRSLPPPRLEVYGEPASAHDLVRLARKNARRRRNRGRR